MSIDLHRFVFSVFYFSIPRCYTYWVTYLFTNLCSFSKEIKIVCLKNHLKKANKYDLTSRTFYKNKKGDAKLHIKWHSITYKINVFNSASSRDGSTITVFQFFSETTKQGKIIHVTTFLRHWTSKTEGQRFWQTRHKQGDTCHIHRWRPRESFQAAEQRQGRQRGARSWPGAAISLRWNDWIRSSGSQGSQSAQVRMWGRR